jgi:phosphoribosylformylglycinamidine (FGAM) synthase-like amidotransferase family enzyme
MRTSIIALVLLAATPLVVQAEGLTWQSDYTAAQKKAVAQQKPLAVIFGQGTNGWQQLSGGSLLPEAGRTLDDKYVYCYVDTATPEGQALAKQFALRSSVGLVVSDRTGNLQAFWHDGTMPADALSLCLTRYGDPQRTVTTTDTNLNGSRTSYYPFGAAFAPSSAAPVCRT